MVTKNLNKDWTAQRMIGYLPHYQKLKMEDVADEMQAILSDRKRIIQKKSMEEVNISVAALSNHYGVDPPTGK